VRGLALFDTDWAFNEIAHHFNRAVFCLLLSGPATLFRALAAETACLAVRACIGRSIIIKGNAVPRANTIRPYANLTIGFLAQNAAIGLTFGCFGLLIDPVAREFGGSRSLLSFSIGMISLVFGLLGPMTGALLDRWSVSKTMIVGCVIGAAGFYLSARAHSAVTFMLAFGLLVGAGFTLMGVLPATKLANAWFPGSLGRATGFANVPLLNGLGPPLFAYILLATDWRSLLQGFAWIFVAVAVLSLFVTVPKKALKPRAQPLFREAADSAAAPSAAAEKPPYRHKVFWIISLAKGMLMSSGIVVITHFVSYGIDNGIAPAKASILLSIFGIASALGALLYGWLCDRLTPFIAMTANGALQFLFWILIILYPNFISLAFVAGGMGLCTGGVATVAMTMLGRAMPPHALGTAIGQMMFAMIPFTFFAAPLAGALYDWHGNYLFAFIFEAAVCCATVLYLNYFRATLRVI
jgi:MFS family permease